MKHDGTAPGQISKFATLEAGRAFAASVVVLYHAGNIVAQPRFYGEHPFAGHLQNFNVGVDFFFVLSGFIIAWVHWEDIGEGTRLPRYAMKRFLRIYPPYWGVLLPLTLLYLLFPTAGLPHQRDPLNILLSIFLLPNPMQPVLGVAWTLVHEVFFYALFSLVILFGRRGLALFPCWAVIILIADAFGELPFPLSFVLNPFNLELILGVATAAVLKTYRMPFPSLLAFSGVGGFLALMLFATDIQSHALTGRLAFGSCAFLAVLGLVEIERRRIVPLPTSLALFGAASYAIYLAHPVALSFGVHALSRLSGTLLPTAAVALLISALGIVTGLLYFRFAEPALIRATRSLLTRSNAPPSQRPRHRGRETTGHSVLPSHEQ
jgi:exopolysaccharide production protein ExoZ